MLNAFLTACKDRVLYPSAHKYLDELNASQWQMSGAENDRVQTEQLKKLLLFTGRHNAYYKQLFAANGFDPLQFAKCEDIRQLPFLTKDIVRCRQSELISSRGRTCLKLTTSGSSGSPVTLLRDRQSQEHILASRWRALGWWGILPQDRAVWLWGRPVDHSWHSGTVSKSVIKNCLHLSAFDMSRDLMRDHVQAILNYKPTYIWGYAGALYKLAEFMIESRFEWKFRSLKLVVSTAEKISVPQRVAIEKAFGCRVADLYNTSEAGLVAAECPNGSLHIQSENFYCEYIPSSTFPGAYELCLTPLFNYKFPLLRYLTGDLVEISERSCSCGRVLPVLKNVYGRTCDIFLSKSGKYIHGAFFGYLVEKINGVVLYRVIQHTTEHVEFMIVKTEAFNPADTGNVEMRVKQLMGDSTRVEFLILDSTDAMPELPAAKHKFIISMVNAGEAEDQH